MDIQKTQELDDFCQTLVQSFNAIKKANEMPPYIVTKARDINASHVSKALEEKFNDPELIKQFNVIQGTRKICSEEEYKTKDAILAYAREIKPLIDRIKSTNFKLMLDRFNAAHEFALKLSEHIDELGIVEELV